MRKQEKKDPASHPGRRKSAPVAKAKKGKTTKELREKMIRDKNARITEDDLKNVVLENTTSEEARKKDPRRNNIDKISRPHKVSKENESPKSDEDTKHRSTWDILGD